MTTGTTQAGVAVLTSRLYQAAENAEPPGLFFWGRGNRAATLLDERFWNGGHDALARRGVPVASGDYSSPAHWGNDAAIASMPAVLNALAAVAGPAGVGRVRLIAVSIGAALALNWARQNPTRVAAIALLTPAVDVEDIRANNRAASAAEIEAAYGGAAAWQTARPTHNPVEYAAALTDIPIAVWRSGDDPTCVPARVDAFAAAAGADVHDLGNVGHSAGTLNGDDVADFLLAHV